MSAARGLMLCFFSQQVFQFLAGFFRTAGKPVLLTRQIIAINADALQLVMKLGCPSHYIYNARFFIFEVRFERRTL